MQSRRAQKVTEAQNQSRQQEERPNKYTSHATLFTLLVLTRPFERNLYVSGVAWCELLSSRSLPGERFPFRPGRRFLKERSSGFYSHACDAGATLKDAPISGPIKVDLPKTLLSILCLAGWDNRGWRSNGHFSPASPDGGYNSSHSPFSSRSGAQCGFGLFKSSKPL